MERFPDDFMFELTNEEAKLLVSPVGYPKLGYPNIISAYTSICVYGTGVLTAFKLLLHSTVAIKVNIMRAFVSIRQYVLPVIPRIKK